MRGSGSTVGWSHLFLQILRKRRKRHTAYDPHGKASYRLAECNVATPLALGLVPSAGVSRADKLCSSTSKMVTEPHSTDSYLHLYFLYFLFFPRMQMGGKEEPLANYIMKARSTRERVDVLSCNILSITSRKASM